MGSDQLRDELLGALASIYELRAFDALAEFLQGELRVLFFLSRHREEEVIPSLLSDSLGVSRSRITAALASLRKKGYVQMQVAEEDRRQMLVTMTPQGGAFLRSKQRKVEQYFDKLVEGMGAANVRELVRLVRLSTDIIQGEGH